MWRRRVLAVALVLGAIAVGIPSAQAQSTRPAIKDLPRPARSTDHQADLTRGSAVLVRFKGSASATARDRALTKRRATRAGDIAGTGFVKVRSDVDASQLAADLARDAAVDAVTLDFPRRATAIPDDELYTEFQQQYLNTVRLPEAWNRVTNAGVPIIAVIDTGVDTSHPELVGRTVPGYNAVSPGSPPTDVNGHGTMVAGIAVANTDNGVGVAGAAWTGRVMPVKVFTGGQAFDSHIAAGITWAVNHNATIINLSLGGPAESPVLHAAVQYATSRGVLVVAAAGNEGTDTPQYPAAYPEVLAVGATDAAGSLTDFSSWGDWVDLAAPGFGIVSTYPRNMGLYAMGDGTSFAAPIVSGVAALVRAADPRLTGDQLADRLRATARDAGPRGIDPYYGYGVLDAAYAVGGGWAPDFPVAAAGPGEPNDVPAQATPFTANNATGSFAVEGDVDWYRYDEASTTREVTLIAWAADGFDPDRSQNVDQVLELYDGHLRLLGRADTHGPGQMESLTTWLSAGTYYVKIRNANGSADPRPYSLMMTSLGDSPFAPYQNYPVGSRPELVGVGDITGDGRNDVLMITGFFGTSPNNNTLFVFPQLADRSLGAPVRYSPIQASISAIAILDVDRDGRLDVALGGSGGVEVFSQTTAGTLTAEGLLQGASTTATSAVVASNMDGDSDIDLVVANTQGISVLAHGAGASFTAMSVAPDGANELEVGDMDGDGSVDLVTSAGPEVRVYHNTDQGWARTQHHASRSLEGIEVADVSGDGRPDVMGSVSFNAPDALIVVLRQDGNGTLSSPETYSAYQIPEPVEAGDINGDGRNDVVTANAGWNAVSVLLQQAGGTLGPAMLTPVPYSSHYNTKGLAIGDIDSDAKPDIVLADYNNGLVVLRQSVVARVGAALEFVRSVTPADGTTGLPLNTKPQIEFSATVNPTSVNSDTIRLLDGRTGAAVPASLAYNATTKTVTVTPSAPLHDNKPYRVVVNGVQTEHDMQAWSFTSTFVTVNQNPAALAGFTVTGGAGAVLMSWTPPAMGDLDQVIVRAAVGTTPPASPSGGIPAYAGTESSIAITGLDPATTYSFAAWVRDRGGVTSTARTATLIGRALTMAADTTSITGETPVTLTGRLTRTDTGAAGSGQIVSLYALPDVRARTADEWTVVGTATSNASGDVALTVTPCALRCTYQWRLIGSSTFMGVVSTTVTVNVVVPPVPRKR